MHKPRSRATENALIMLFGGAGLLLTINQTLNLNLLGEVLVDNTFLYLEIGLFLSIAFLLYPLHRDPKRRAGWLDWIAFLLCVAVSGYLAWHGPAISDLGWVHRAPRLADIASAMLVMLALEGVRRAGGTVMLLVCSVFAFFPMVAHLLPGVLWSPQLDPLAVLREHALGTESILGLPIRVVTEVLMGYLIFGAALIVTGGGKVFMDLALALLGRTRGGTAKVAVLSSALFGSLSGSVLSNVVTTGKLTIPAMRRAGFPPAYAAGVEACASTGGTLMPPVMGSVAFIMADFLRIPYTDVAVAALVPSVLFYLALMVQVDLYAAKHRLQSTVEEDIPDLGTVLRHGWHHIVALCLLTYLLLVLRMETLAPYWATAFVVGVTVVRRQAGLAVLVSLLRESTETVVNVFAILVGIGMIIGALSFTGVGPAFSRELLLLAGGNLYLLLGLGALTSFILGMGMTITACYLLLAVILPPALIAQGLNPVAVHLFILYWGMLSFITPPVALAALAAGSIAGVDPMSAGLKAMRLGSVLFVLPFIFVLNPELILVGSIGACLYAASSAALGIVLVSFALEGWMYRVGRIGFAARAVLLAAALLLMIPGVETDLYGAGLLIATIVAQLLARRNPASRLGPSPAAPTPARAPADGPEAR